MIKENELRIGNIVYACSKITTIDSVHSDRESVNLCIYTGGWGDSGCVDELNIMDLKPIPLTEEWLLKFGFKRIHDKNNHYTKRIIGRWANINHGISIFIDEKLGWNIALSNELNGYKDFIVNNNIESVHQLQNLYFALTGSELEFQK